MFTLLRTREHTKKSRAASRFVNVVSSNKGDCRMDTRIAELLAQLRASHGAQYVYENSVHSHAGCTACMLNCGEYDLLAASGGAGFAGDIVHSGGQAWAVGPLSHENALALRKAFPFCAPVSVLKKPRSVGVGDRLGLATPGHIRVFSQYDAYPVFAQQSIRELTLTGRSFHDVLDCASFAVFREGYTRGFGADGDHLKTSGEVRQAIDCGYTMITLDCSEHIDNSVMQMRDEQVLAAYVPQPALEEKYVGREFSIGGASFAFSRMDFMRISLIYGKAIDFAVSIYETLFAGRDEALDFEMSIDETATPTSPAQHYFVARELLERGVRPATIAPRFCGEFQKGIDYIGDLRRFEEEFRLHAAIAAHFGYKLSIHSGSDKFSVFPIIGKYTQGRFHLKTAGTNWLEAMRVIAQHESALYRRIHQYALDSAFAAARQYYHVSTNLDNIPPLASLSDSELPALFENDDARQLIHITYGLILTARDDAGAYRFRDSLYSAWRQHAAQYEERLAVHIGRHLSLLYSGFNA